ncbi:hypothetical protein BN7_3857 [Wickerhamomyces ciferrii]|uniref:Uncharacterized protein n=1 Tax=Wickerhamomyces ciferrii (strain ATCC 14091 / BCRC 22168 / CBS 111 / JCM 3599 / NBRC 0793 / NRRL Y-1031 F-60-10) TaxID=1206466 RepID=K0KGM2_WICCF|nr:uncharacterized protein BN7_3857 [Wickerhamomyces ciferrii]CCH44295.1 hypothetical protein BN7_3857 [Wickerhamomyces ciferrii]
MTRLSDLPDHCLEYIFLEHLDYQFEGLKALYRVDKQFGGLIRRSIGIITNDKNLPNHQLLLVDGFSDLNLVIVDNVRHNYNKHYKFYFVNYNLELGYDMKLFQLFNDSLGKQFKINFFRPNYHIKISHSSGIVLKQDVIESHAITEHYDEHYDEHIFTDDSCIAENKILQNLQQLTTKKYLLGYNEFYVGAKTSNNLQDELSLRPIDSSFNIKGNKKTSEDNFTDDSLKEYIKRLVITNYSNNWKLFEIDNLHLENLEELYLDSGMLEDRLSGQPQDMTSVFDGVSRDKIFEEYFLYSLSNNNFPNLQKLKLMHNSKLISLHNSKLPLLDDLKINNNVMLNIDNCDFTSLKSLEINQLFDISKIVKEDQNIANFAKDFGEFCGRYDISYEKIKSINFLNMKNTDLKSIENLHVPNVKLFEYFKDLDLANLKTLKVTNISPNLYSKIIIFFDFPDNDKLQSCQHVLSHSDVSKETLTNFFKDVFRKMLRFQNKDATYLSLFTPLNINERKSQINSSSTLNKDNELELDVSTSVSYSSLPIVRCQSGKGKTKVTNVFYYSFVN